MSHSRTSSPLSSSDNWHFIHSLTRLIGLVCFLGFQSFLLLKFLVVIMMFALQVLHKITSVERLRILSAMRNRLRTGLANGIYI